MNQHRRRAGRLAMVITASVILGGCQTPVRDIPESSSVIDPCADRLHDICGPLLLYYSLNKRLPATLDDLGEVSGQVEMPPLVCPVSGKPYIYRPEGLRVLDLSGRLVLYDAAPAHANMRWGIVIPQRHGGGALTTRVLSIPEDSVQAAQRQEHVESEDRTQD